MGKNEFSDILNAQGFKATSEQEPGSQTLKSLKKEQNKPDDPVKAKVRACVLSLLLTSVTTLVNVDRVSAMLPK